MTRTVIVLVEDDPMSRMVALDAFERADFDVEDFTRVDEAMAFVERMPERIAAVVADIQVPGERDGIDLVCTVRDRWPEVAVMVTSGRFGATGPDDLPAAVSFLPKPWTAKTLLEKMRKVLGEQVTR